MLIVENIRLILSYLRIQHCWKNKVKNTECVEQLDSVLSSGNRKLLAGAGSVSHDQAMKKAKDEYRKYQEITLSPVEEEYLKSIRGVEKEVKKHSMGK